MTFLKALEGIRCEFLNSIMLAVTELGSEISFALIAMLFLWCIDKKWGYRLFAIFFTGLTLNEGLKMVFHIQRPYERNLTLNPLTYETGYSFPSGHTCTATLVFGSTAAIVRKKWVTIVCAVLTALVMFTRLYLGVHTPYDVICSLAVASVVVFLFFLLFKLCEQKNIPNFDFWILAAVALIAVAACIIVGINNDATLVDSRENAYKMLGCMLAMLVSWIADNKFLHYETKAKLWQQTVKYGVGLGLLLGIKQGLKAVFALFIPNIFLSSFIRYFLIMFFAGTLWPMTFKLYKNRETK